MYYKVYKPELQSQLQHGNSVQWPAIQTVVQIDENMQKKNFTTFNDLMTASENQLSKVHISKTLTLCKFMQQ